MPSMPQTLSIQENNGQSASPSRKSEINLLAVHAGLSVPLKLCPTESASSPTNKTKPESQLKICSTAVSHVVWDATVVIQVLHGVISRAPVSSLEVFMVKLIIASLTQWLLALITLLHQSIQLVDHPSQPHLVRRLAKAHLAEPTLAMSERERAPIQLVARRI